MTTCPIFLPALSLSLTQYWPEMTKWILRKGKLTGSGHRPFRISELRLIVQIYLNRNNGFIQALKYAIISFCLSWWLVNYGLCWALRVSSTMPCFNKPWFKQTKTWYIVWHHSVHNVWLLQYLCIVFAQLYRISVRLNLLYSLNANLSVSFLMKKTSTGYSSNYSMVPNT